MTDRIEHIRPILDRPFFYEFYHSLIGANYRSRVLVSEYIRPKPSDRILDIGCGPGTMLPFLPECQYLGVDANPAYIALARQRYCYRGEFICERVATIRFSSSALSTSSLLSGWYIISTIRRRRIFFAWNTLPSRRADG